MGNFTAEEIESMKLTIMPDRYNREQAMDIAVNTKNPFVKEYMLIRLDNFSMLLSGNTSFDNREEELEKLIIYGYAWQKNKEKEKSLFTLLKNFLT